MYYIHLLLTDFNISSVIVTEPLICSNMPYIILFENITQMFNYVQERVIVDIGLLAFFIFPFSSITAVSDIYIELGVYLMETIGSMDIVQQFHSGIAEQQRALVLQQFLSGSSQLRILVSTVAFGMGVSVGDVRYIIHWGLSSTVVSYWQEVGRGLYQMNFYVYILKME